MMTHDCDSLALAAGPALAVQGRGRLNGYYDCARPELAVLVPLEARRVLDVGCGSGVLGRQLRNRGHEVCGIELIPAMARVAAERLDEVVCGDVETTALPWPTGTFDAVLCGDVLEHLLDPWQTLHRLSSLLVPGGLLIASIPNVQNYRVIRGLVLGRWRYRERGLMDLGHLRFFTWREIEKLFAQAGLEIVKRHSNWRRTFPRRLLNALTLNRLDPFLARSYVVVGQLPPANTRA
jgi:2-polyprenyl-3-methyl-5-hydroxy-6-metoxy-1,4-benzoquinol methylase